MNKKNIFAIAALLLGLTACENDDVTFPDYDYATVYFANQYVARTIELGEDPEWDLTLDNQHQFEVKAITGGSYANERLIQIRYAVDDEMLQGLTFDDGSKIYPLPHSYYTLSSDNIYIQPGQQASGVTVSLTDDFFADANSLKNCYVLPLRMTLVQGADSILRGTPQVDSPSRFVASDWLTAPKDYVLYAVKYVNPWHGVYLRRGQDEITAADGTQTINRRAYQYVENSEQVTLTTTAYRQVSQTLVVKGSDGSNNSYTVLYNFDEDGKCTITSADADRYTVSGSGLFVKDGDKNSWGNKDRNAIFADYTVNMGGTTIHTTDTLVINYRNVKFETFSPVLSE